MNYKEEELLNRYQSIQTELASNYEEIRITEELLNDRKLDYLTVREYKSDIINSELVISKLKRELKEIKAFAKINNIKLVDEEENAKVLKKETSHK